MADPDNNLPIIDVLDLFGEVRELLDAAYMAARDIDDSRMRDALRRLLGNTSDIADTVAEKLEDLLVQNGGQTNG